MKHTVLIKYLFSILLIVIGFVLYKNIFVRSFLYHMACFLYHIIGDNAVDHKETGERQARRPCSNHPIGNGAKAWMMG